MWKKVSKNKYEPVEDPTKVEYVPPAIGNYDKTVVFFDEFDEDYNVPIHKKDLPALIELLQEIIEEDKPWWEKSVGGFTLLGNGRVDYTSNLNVKRDYAAQGNLFKTRGEAETESLRRGNRHAIK